MRVGERDAQILQAVQRYCDEIAETVKLFGDDENIFTADYVYRNACSMPLQTIGELAKSFSSDFINKHSEIPWQEIKGMRNLFAHAYDKGIDFITVWNTIKYDVPILREFCVKTLLENNYEIIKLKNRNL